MRTKIIQKPTMMESNFDGHACITKGDDVTTINFAFHKKKVWTIQQKLN